MTENTDLSAFVKPTPETFDLAEWLGDGKSGRPVHTCIIYRDLSFMADLEGIERRIKAEKDMDTAAGEDALGGGTDTSALEAEAAVLMDKMAAQKVTVRIRGLIESEVNKILKKTGENGNNISEKTKFEVLAEAVEYPKLDASGWEKMTDAIGHGQFTLLWTTYVLATNGVPNVGSPFSRKS